MKNRTYIIAVFFIILLVVFSFFGGYFSGIQVRLKPDFSRISNRGANAESNTRTEVQRQNRQEENIRKIDFSLFWDVWDLVKNNYVEKEIDDKKLFYGAISGVVASLNDPYSVFLEPETAQKFQQELMGELEGIGAEIGLRDDVITIIAPLPGSPAKRAGVLSGDKILSIDGADTLAMSLDYAVSLIRGPKGTKVKLLLLHNGEREGREYVITRDTIKIVSVEWEEKVSDIAYIELKYFNQDTLSSFNKVAREILAKKPKGIILDLRNNPGGLLVTAIEISAEWVGKNEIIVIEKMRDKKFVGHKAEDSRARFKGIPTVVLINKGSASGSEIVAGALQDYKLATIIGETSFGKGSVQDLRQLRDGSSLKLTIAKWLTPGGREIEKQGIKPDIEIKMTSQDSEEEKDLQLEKALELLNQR